VAKRDAKKDAAASKEDTALEKNSDSQKGSVASVPKEARGAPEEEGEGEGEKGGDRLQAPGAGCREEAGEERGVGVGRVLRGKRRKCLLSLR